MRVSLSNPKFALSLLQSTANFGFGTLGSSVREMRAAGLALACVVIGGSVAVGYHAADRDLLAGLGVLDFLHADASHSESKPYPLANRDRKYDRVAPLRTDRLDVDPQQALQRGDSLRQSYAAVDPAAPVQQSAVAQPAPLPKPRPRAMILRRQQASYTLLSDLQIDAIRARLKLTAEQERAWPAVEEALRGLATRLHAMKAAGEQPTGLQSDSDEFAKLKAATTPFIATLTNDQKRELRMLAHLIGLGPVVAKL